MVRQGNAEMQLKGFPKALITCVHCTSAALLEVEGAPLCGKCILEKTEQREPEWIVAHTRPLDLPVKKAYG